MNTLKSKLALVTGGCGFIGSHVVERLIAEGWRVRVLDDLSTGHLRNLEAVRDRVELLEGSITDAELIGRATERVEVIFHFAAKVFVPESFEKPEEYERVNVHGTAMLLEAAKRAGVSRVVFSSTCAVYGNPVNVPIAESDPVNPLSPYARTKLAGEALGKKSAENGGPDFTVLRYFNVYGPRQDPRSAYSGVISRFAAAIAQGERPVVHGDGLQTRDFVYVQDIVRANQLASNRGDTPFAIYNIGTGRETTIRDLLALLARGRPVLPVLQAARKGDIARSAAAIGRAQEKLALGAMVPIETGVRRLLGENLETAPGSQTA